MDIEETEQKRYFDRSQGSKGQEKLRKKKGKTYLESNEEKV